MDHQLIVSLADHYSLPRVKQFFKRNGMRAQAPKGELIYVAQLDSQLVCALRLQPLGPFHLLRSLCVASELRQQGIGHSVLSQMQPILSPLQCYCFAYPHLEPFYQRAGFITLQTEQAPHDIRNKFLGYTHKGKALCLMKHQAKPC